MTKRIIIGALSLILLASACKKDGDGADETESTSPTETAEWTFGHDGELTGRNATLFARDWFKAVQDDDWKTLEAVFTPDAEIVIDRGQIVDRVSPDVWKSQMGARKGRKSATWKVDKLDFAEFDGGAFFRVTVADQTKANPLPPQTWEFVMKNVAGKAKLAQLFQREERPRAKGAPARELGSLVLADGLVLQPHAPTDAERGYRTLLDKRGLAELWVDSSKLPREWQELENQPFEVFDASGERCQTKVSGFRYYAVADAPLWLESVWEKKLDDKLPRRAAGEAAWQMAGDAGRALVARFNPSGMTLCENPIWARRLSNDPYMLFEKEASNDFQTEALDRFENLPSVQSIQQEYERMGNTGAWFELGVPPVINVFASDARTFVTVSANAGSTCNDFVAGTFAIWEVTGEKWSLLTPAEDADGEFEPLFAADVNNDGSPEFYGDGVVVRQAAGSYRIVEDLRPVSFDGGC